MKRRTENPVQLPMFMTAREIMSQYKPNPADREEIPGGRKGAIRAVRRERDDEVWTRKAEEAKYDFFNKTRDPDGVERSLADSVQRYGVRYPISLTRTRVVGGHHRVAAADPDDYMPVLHFESLKDAKRSLSGGAGYVYT